jgi:hypothetical protein
MQNYCWICINLTASKHKLNTCEYASSLPATTYEQALWANFKVYLHFTGHQHSPFPAMPILPYGKISLGQHWTKNN